MARRDVISYYLDIQNQYFEMLADVKDLEEAVKNGELPEDRIAQAQEWIEVIKENYNRISYIMFLLNAPNKKEKKTKYMKQNKDLVKALEPYSETAVLDENADVLKGLKKMLKETKNG